MKLAKHIESIKEQKKHKSQIYSGPKSNVHLKPIPDNNHDGDPGPGSGNVVGSRVLSSSHSISKSGLTKSSKQRTSNTSETQSRQHRIAALTDKSPLPANNETKKPKKPIHPECWRCHQSNPPPCPYQNELIHVSGPINISDCLQCETIKSEFTREVVGKCSISVIKTVTSLNNGIIADITANCKTKKLFITTTSDNITSKEDDLIQGYVKAIKMKMCTNIIRLTNNITPTETIMYYKYKRETTVPYNTDSSEDNTESSSEDSSETDMSEDNTV